MKHLTDEGVIDEARASLDELHFALDELVERGYDYKIERRKPHKLPRIRITLLNEQIL